MKAWNRERLERIEIEKQPGRPPKLDEAEQEQLFETVLKSLRKSGYKFSMWTLKAISEHMSREFGKEISESGISRLFDRNDIVQIKPCPMPAKADPKKNAISNGV